MNNKRDITYAFIDSQNLNLGIRHLGWRLDYKEFNRYLKDKFKVQKAILFIGFVKGNEKLYKFLKNSGYSIVFKPTIGYKSKGKVETKGNVDAELVLHAAAIEYKNYDKAIIVSGDGDFHCLIEYLVKNNKLKSLIIPNNKKYSSLLREFNKYFFYMNNLKQKLEIKNERH